MTLRKRYSTYVHCISVQRWCKYCFLTTAGCGVLLWYRDAFSDELQVQSHFSCSLFCYNASSMGHQHCIESHTDAK